MEPRPTGEMPERSPREILDEIRTKLGELYDSAEQINDLNSQVLVNNIRMLVEDPDGTSVISSKDVSNGAIQFGGPEIGGTILRYVTHDGKEIMLGDECVFERRLPDGESHEYEAIVNQIRLEKTEAYLHLVSLHKGINETVPGWIRPQDLKTNITAILRNRERHNDTISTRSVM
jgi:hypothetical protein